MPSQILDHYNVIMSNAIKYEKYQVTFIDGSTIIGIPFMGSTSKPIEDQEFSLKRDAGTDHYRLDEIVTITKV